MITTDIKKAVSVLQQDGIIGLPTETVYGLAGSAFSEKAIKAIYTIKNRPFENPLIVHLPNKEVIQAIVKEIPEEIEFLLETFSPGPVTFILPKKPTISDLVTAGKPNVAFRIPSHPTAIEVLEKIDFPLVAPSANPFQRISPVTAQQVDDYFNKEELLVLEGGTSYLGIESTILGFENNSVVMYREGYLTKNEIEKYLNYSIQDKSDAKAVTAPGMYKKHYAPSCPMIIALDIEKEIERWQHKKIGLLTLQPTNFKVYHSIGLSTTGTTKEALSNLYNAMHVLEKAKVDLIITQIFPNDAHGFIINQRIIKASYI